MAYDCAARCDLAPVDRCALGAGSGPRPRLSGPLGARAATACPPRVAVRVAPPAGGGRLRPLAGAASGESCRHHPVVQARGPSCPVPRAAGVGARDRPSGSEHARAERAQVRCARVRTSGVHGASPTLWDARTDAAERSRRTPRRGRALDPKRRATAAPESCAVSEVRRVVRGSRRRRRRLAWQRHEQPCAPPNARTHRSASSTPASAG